MKKIEAIIRPDNFDKVKNALYAIGIRGITLTEIKGHGKQGGIKQQWRGSEYTVEFLPKIKIEIVANDDMVETITKTITNYAKTGEVGDGKIFIIPVDEVIRVRTGEKGTAAI